MRTDSTQRLRPTAITPKARSPYFWVLLAWAVIWQIGAHVDARYHVHSGFEIDSFFTAPHYLLYGGWIGFLVTAVLSVKPYISGPGIRGLASIPGAPLILAGGLLFGLGGMWDFLWHSLFGFEVDLETLVAPSHNWLVVSYGVAVGGLLQAAVGRWSERNNRSWLPTPEGMAIGMILAMLLRTALWAMGYTNPLGTDYPTEGRLAGHLWGLQGIDWSGLTAQIAGTTGMILHAILLALFVVSPLRRLRLPGGSLLLVIGWQGLMAVSVSGLWQNLIAVVGAALIGELLWAWMWQGGLGGVSRKVGYWTLGLLVPFSELGLLFILLAVSSGGLAWSVHLWTGALTLAGLYGVAASLLVVPPGIDSSERQT